MRVKRWTAMAAGVAILGGCSLAPVYQTPAVSIATDSWKDQPWQSAQPADDLPHGQWWQIYGDPTLDALEAKIDQDNPTLAAALARYDQATAYIRQSQAAQLPTLDSGASLTHNRQSDHRPLRGSNQPDVYSANTIGVGLNYELDVWGRVRNLVESAKAGAQASAADLESVRLSLHAQLADNYVRLRGVDAQAKLLNDTVSAYTRALSLTQNRHAGGVASGLDVARAETQLSSVRAQAADIASQRALFEHAIASLTGQPAMNFSLPMLSGTMAIPHTPVGMPSTLLQRRPDIAAAERRTAAANANIGVARAAYYPSISLGALFGVQNTGQAGLLSAPNNYWTLGPSVVFNLFDGGLRDAKVTEARAALDQTGAEYRATVLAAFQQVEDDLSRLKYDHEGELDQNAAVQSAEKTLTLAFNRYREGAVNYLEVVTAQAAALAAERSALDLHTQQLRTSVDLIRALGGGWSQEPDQNQATAKTAMQP
ncbi:efflux transporter outer membrane subunit [Solimicrobium silvestre]|uniref:Efflux transporter, outer membrane factor (OMF) lipoprotein, NodT family n=1 Tax=Solimicrobium silvestre TaxID=2099400 RepID=A0A2S9H0Y8_9BURK|nr:efflux transporter outer membrane subunit [Solimicrobium silvestre]PRC93655.1 Efflux transporter, outer membrane factor (OMF) lipoprotein, NodT family [Solimicrobium silvestre]